jgi:hypothetical protein
MLELLRRAPAKRAGRAGRVILRLDEFEGRATPGGDASGLGYGPGDPAGKFGAAGPPRIINFAIRDMGYGMYAISGQVLDSDPSGLTVWFSGLQTMDGTSVTTDVNGFFCRMVVLNTDGSDTGYLSAVTTDRAGLESNEPSIYVDPSS